MIKTIGFYGGSFCTEITSPHSLWNNYTTYMKKISKHYNAKIVHTGQGGCSIWDTALMQLTTNVPDICIFAWPPSGRLYHKKVRRLNCGDAISPKLHTYNPLFSSVWEAAKQYYLHIFDEEFSMIEYQAAIEYIDNHVLSKITTQSRIIHLWSSENNYVWKRGVTIQPDLLKLSNYGNNEFNMQIDKRPNHLEGEFKNSLLSSWIIEAVDNYLDGTVLVKSINNTTQH